MATSRIFVRGLPPSYTDIEFRDHFAKRYAVTDAKLFPQRRIGYVGFKTPQDAASAVKYFNKTFIRMSKIWVELARDISKPEVIHPTKRQGGAEQPEQEAVSSSLKRKRDEAKKPTDDAKLQEYLELMKAPSKPKTSLGDLNLVNHETVTLEEHPKVLASASDGETPLKPTKLRKEVHKQVPLPSTPAVTVNTDETKDSPVQDAPFDKNNHGSAPTDSIADSNDPSAAQGEKSDMDWMRSRTSRLLGLVEDDDEESPMPQSRRDIEIDVHQGSVGDTLTDDVSDSRNTALHPELVVDAGIGNVEDETISDSGRLFLRNLVFSVTEDEIKELFESDGDVEEVHIPLDRNTGSAKGFAFVQFKSAEDAVRAFHRLDGTVFQGRLLHIVPATAKRESKIDEFALSKLPLKKQRQISKKAEASTSSFNWNSMYMNADAVLSSISDRLGVSKSEILDPSSSDAAVKQAQAETHIIQETKAYFQVNGVDLKAFNSRARGDLAILIKNFPYGTSIDDLRKMFSEFGDITRMLMPPSGTIAIVEYAQITQARTAFASLAYRKFKDTVLFLEKAPKDLFTGPPSSVEVVTGITAGATAKTPTSELVGGNAADDIVDTGTLFVRNLNFTTTNQRLQEVFRPLDGFISARVKTKTDPKRPGQLLSMGFGFLEFKSKEQAKAALQAMDGYNLDGHQLLVRASHKGKDAAEERRKEDSAKRSKNRTTKIIIKNLPFEASKKDIRTLFSAYGELRAVRVPKKFDNSRKGYAFAEFTTTKEAENAMDALRDTHLLGRRLVLDFAAGETDDAEVEIEKMQQKVGRQSNSIALQRLTNNGRKKFNVGDGNETQDA